MQSLYLKLNTQCIKKVQMNLAPSNQFNTSCSHRSPNCNLTMPQAHLFLAKNNHMETITPNTKTKNKTQQISQQFNEIIHPLCSIHPSTTYWFVSKYFSYPFSFHCIPLPYTTDNAHNHLTLRTEASHLTAFTRLLFFIPTIPIYLTKFIKYHIISTKPLDTNST